MRNFLVRTARRLFTKAYDYGVSMNFLNAPYTGARLMNTGSVKPPPPKSLSGENWKMRLLETPQCELDATLYRKKIERDSNNTDAIYGLAVSIGHGATIYPRDIRGTRLDGIWLQKISPRDLQAELYRRILKLNSRHAEAIWGLAQCIKNGTTPQIEDLHETWLEGGHFIVDGRWNLSKSTTSALVDALEKLSKALENSMTDVTNTKVQKTSPMI